MEYPDHLDHRSKLWNAMAIIQRKLDELMKQKTVPEHVLSAEEKEFNTIVQRIRNTDTDVCNKPKDLKKYYALKPKFELALKKIEKKNPILYKEYKVYNSTLNCCEAAYYKQALSGILNNHKRAMADRTKTKDHHTNQNTGMYNSYKKLRDEYMCPLTDADSKLDKIFSGDSA